MQIRILVAGKIRESYLREGIAIYLTRLATYHKVIISELPARASSGKRSSPGSEHQREETGNMLLAGAGSVGFIIALDAAGEAWTSEELASRLHDLELRGCGPAVFLVGGAFGLPPTVLDRADIVLSLSPMTFPHQMVPLLLAEQLYRAACINANVPYHK